MASTPSGSASGNRPASARRRRVRTPEETPWIAWGLFLVLGVPLALMAFLTMAARSGVYVDVLRPLWMPWPPDFLKPLVGVLGFAATLGYLAYRLGSRAGFVSGTVAGIAQGRNWTEGRYAASEASSPTPGAETPPPPPPPEEHAAASSSGQPSGGNGT